MTLASRAEDLFLHGNGQGVDLHGQGVLFEEQPAQCPQGGGRLDQDLPLKPQGKQEVQKPVKAPARRHRRKEPGPSLRRAGFPPPSRPGR
ncbi:MAG: hypothetical protein MZU91_11965 [Desulfosudis oleivorans]|nr:hypothetical protein [Desulfosudis oleivorans]